MTVRIERTLYLNKLIERRDNGSIKVITGLRRCGKTFLVKNLYCDWLRGHGVPNENILYLALDQNSNAKYRNPVILDSYLRDRIQASQGRCYVIIDGIQYSVPVPNEALPQEVRSKENAITFYDTVLGLMDLCDVYVTGTSEQRSAPNRMNTTRPLFILKLILKQQKKRRRF